MWRRKSYLVFALVVLATTLFAVVPPRASAASGHFSSDTQITAEFVDMSLIHVTVTGSYIDSQNQQIDLSPASGYYYDNNSSDNTFNYRQGGDNKVGVSDGCQSQITLANRGEYDKLHLYSNPQNGKELYPDKYLAGDKPADITLVVPPTGTTSTKCITQTFPNEITVTDPNNASQITYIQNGNNLNRADSDPRFDGNSGEVNKYTFNQTQTSNGTVYLNTNSGDTCPDYITLGSGTGTVSATLTDQKNASPCAVNHQTPIFVLGADANQTVTTAAGSVGNCTTDPTASSCTQAQSNPEMKCSASLLNPLSWIACPIIFAANQAVNAYDSQIQKELDVDSNKYLNENDTTPGGGGSYYQIWSAVRYIAMSLLVLIGLVMVVSQAVGSDLFDAYTVRKILPRLIAAVILVALSWPLAKYLIDVSNVLGQGIRTIIYFPFRNTVSTLHTSIGSDGLLTVGGLAGAAILGMAGILLYALAAILAVFAALITLVVRKILIIFLVVLAPIAIVGYILPGTQRIWKMWWDNFLRLLMMFPIIMAFIAAGRVFAITAQNTETGLLGQIMMFIAYFGPYFALPLTFKMGGSLMSMAAGGIRGISQMGTKRLTAAGNKRAAENMHNMATGTRFNNRGLNALTSRLATKRLGLGAQGRAAYGQKMDLAAAEFGKTAGGQSVQHNDPVLRALTYGSAIEASRNMARDWSLYKDASGNATGDRSLATEASIREADAQVSQAIAGTRAMGGFGRQRQVWAAQQLSLTGTGYDSGRIDQVAQTIARVSHGNEDMINSLAGNINSTTKASRHDLAPGFGTLSKLAKQEAGLEGGVKDYGGAAENAWNSASLYQHANDKPQNLKAAAAHWTDRYASALAMTPGAARDEELKKSLTAMQEMRAMLPNSSGENKNIINDVLRNFEAQEQSYAQQQGFIGTTMGPQSAQQAGAQSAYETIKREAAKEARTYERFDPNLTQGTGGPLTPGP